MSMTMHVDVVSAEKQVYSGPVTMLVAPAEMGEVGIAPRHAPLVTRIKPGEIRVTLSSGEEQSFFVSGGILEVQKSVVTILADTAIRASDIDEAEAIAAKERAEEALREQKDSIDFTQVQRELAEAAARLSLIQKIKKSK
ncbi:MAG: F0F1 ATP synthase subunit epsilon [Gammaproteobacteria bacterium]|nr:F0F1 ATP synthase subunit epsilon [Gammaproteobacteria bacterium]